MSRPDRPEKVVPNSRETDALFREMANSLPLIVWVHDAAGRQVMVNDTFCEFFGVTREEMKGGRWKVLMHPDDADAYAREFAACTEARRPFHAEVRVKRADGAWRWLESWGRPRFTEDGEFRGMVGTSADVTEQKHSQAQLREAYALIEGITEDTEDLIAAEDREFRYTYFNEAYFRDFERLWGQQIEVGTSMLEALTRWPEEQRKAKELWARALAGESFRIEMEFGPTGERTNVYDLRFSPIRDAHGRVTGAAHIIRDVTDRVRMEAALRESEERFRNLADNMAQLAWMADETGSIFWYNQRWYEFTGTTLEEAEGWGWTKLHHPDHLGRVVERMKHSWETGEVWEDVFPLRGRDGDYRWFLSRAQPIRNKEGRVVRWFGTNTDVTQQRESEAKLREADRRKDEFLAMLGHELRNPLAAVKSATELVKLTEPKEPLLERAAEVLERQTTQMARLIDGLLEVSRIARGKIQLDRQAVDLRAVLEELISDRSAAIAERGLALESTIGSRPVWVHGDQVRLTQVFDNVLGNALKFTEAPGTVRTELVEDDEHVRVRVRDTGVGIRPEMLDRIFEPFQQEAQELARGTGGLGLGLALARGLVELHGGSIEARSAGRGRGTEIEVTLPPASAPTADEPRSASSSRPARRILLVEDNRDAARMLCDVLTLKGHSVVVAGTAREAIEELERGGFDVVFCDLGLPGMNGFDLARIVREEIGPSAPPLIALTGYGQPEDRRRTEEAGFDDHLVKPVDLDAVQALLDRVVPT